MIHQTLTKILVCAALLLVATQATNSANVPAQVPAQVSQQTSPLNTGSAPNQPSFSNPQAVVSDQEAKQAAPFNASASAPASAPAPQTSSASTTVPLSKEQASSITTGEQKPKLSEMQKVNNQVPVNNNNQIPVEYQKEASNSIKTHEPDPSSHPVNSPQGIKTKFADTSASSTTTISSKQPEVTTKIAEVINTSTTSHSSTLDRGATDSTKTSEDKSSPSTISPTPTQSQNNTTTTASSTSSSASDLTSIEPEAPSESHQTTPHADKQGSQPSPPAAIEKSSSHTVLISLVVVASVVLAGFIIGFVIYRYKNRNHEGNLHD